MTSGLFAVCLDNDDMWLEAAGRENTDDCFQSEESTLMPESQHTDILD